MQKLRNYITDPKTIGQNNTWSSVDYNWNPNPKIFSNTDIGYYKRVYSYIQWGTSGYTVSSGIFGREVYGTSILYQYEPIVSSLEELFSSVMNSISVIIPVYNPNNVSITVSAGWVVYDGSMTNIEEQDNGYSVTIPPLSIGVARYFGYINNDGLSRYTTLFTGDTSLPANRRLVILNGWTFSDQSGFHIGTISNGDPIHGTDNPEDFQVSGSPGSLSLNAKRYISGNVLSSTSFLGIQSSFDGKPALRLINRNTFPVRGAWINTSITPLKDTGQFIAHKYQKKILPNYVAVNHGVQLQPPSLNVKQDYTNILSEEIRIRWDELSSPPSELFLNTAISYFEPANIWLTDLTLIDDPDYDGSPFSGDDEDCYWIGTPNNSESIKMIGDLRILNNWDSSGEKFYEAGIDRGVVYPHGKSPEIWNGLTSVSESINSTEPTPVYQDGSIINFSATESFIEGSIEAFTYPDIFEECLGVSSFANYYPGNYPGLKVAQQPQRLFDLSYRTLIGNDTYSTSYGYKLHILYNCLATNDETTYDTINSDTEPTRFSWKIQTISPKRSEIHPRIIPTSIMIFDSRKVPWAVMQGIEKILYGWGLTPPRTPTIDEIVEIYNTVL